MRFPPKRIQSFAFIVMCAVAFAAIAVLIAYHFSRHSVAGSADAFLQRADEMSWNDQWLAAEPIYKQAEEMFVQNGNSSKALYAQVSQIPPHSESASIRSTINALTADLSKPEAKDPETQLRILVILGMIETNYDAGFARATWGQVAGLARSQNHYLLASRAIGEEGISAFILGDTSTAKKEVLAAWEISKIFHDVAAHVRDASVYGAGLVEFHRYKEALIPLDEAISTANANPAVGYPDIAINSKIDALRGLHQYQDAISLANQALAQIPNPSLKGHYYRLFESRAIIYEALNQWPSAINDFLEALAYAKELDYWRGIAQVGGELAQAYQHQGNFRRALSVIDEAIDANKQIPDELYFVPRNLAIKASIEAELGQRKQAEDLYQKSTALIDSFLKHVPTRNVERLLLAEMGDVYSGYFVTVCRQHDYDKALHVLEEARGRIEAQALQHHDYAAPHPPTPDERQLTELNLELINTDDRNARQELTRRIYDTELKTDQISLASITSSTPIRLPLLKADLSRDEVLIEYVLANPHSYALAVTRNGVHSYELAARDELEALSMKYRSSIRDKRVDSALGGALFNELLAPISEFRNKSTIIIVPDGDLHFLPFGALTDSGSYLVASRIITTSPSATVFALLRDKQKAMGNHPLPFVGVAAWTNASDNQNPIFRSISGPNHASLQPLPESRREVETIAADPPKPNTILLGADATETHFKSLPLANYNVLHLALHGYVDSDYPDRSALVFAPQQDNTDDGMLQVREIRNLHLNAELVTLSACDTGVGPVGEDGVANLVNAFIEAGADTVVSTLWELEDHSTVQLMTHFYDSLAKGEPKGAALRDAQCEMMKDGFAPYYWASFELVGDPDGTI